jgi:hypothetical protein
MRSARALFLIEKRENSEGYSQDKSRKIGI